MRLAATVDYNKLPGGVEALTRLKKNHQKIKLDYTASVRYCKLSGSYSDVQAALTELLSPPGGPELAENDSSRQAAPSSSWSQVSENQSNRANKKREQRETSDTDKSSDGESSCSGKNLAPGANDWGVITGEVSTEPRSPTPSMEDFSLIVDADMFQYLQKRCKKEYQQILSQYGVEVVSETNQGLTTLFLQVADATRMDDGYERLKLARVAISRLYQENEGKICRDHLPKFILRSRAMDSLSVRFPKLLLNEDEQNVYFIGNTSDVSEAKRALLLDKEEASDEKEDDASLNSTSPVEVDSTYEEEDSSDNYKIRAEERSKYKLAARFKDALLGGLGSRPPDFTFRPNSLPSRQPRHGPVLGHDVFPETTQISGGAVSRALNTGDDILFRTPPSALTQVKTSLNTDMIDSQLKTSTSPWSTTPSNFSESILRPPVGSGSTLKRANSFSGTPQQRAQVVVPKSRDDSSKSTIRTAERSSSFSSQAVKDKQEVHSAGITVSKLVWDYIKEVYSARVMDLTTEVQMTESSVAGIRELTVLLKGADSSKVRLCQEHLEKLVASVNIDFSVKELRWPELGVTDPENETLKACCSEVRSRFKKIVVHRSKNALYLTGPEEMCSQIAATLREVFSGEPEHHGLSSPSTHLGCSATSLQPIDPKSADLNNSQLLLGTQTDKTDNQQWRTTYERDFGWNEGLNGSSSQSSVKNDPFVETAGVVEENRHMMERTAHRSATGKDTSPVNGDLSADTNRDLQTPQTERRRGYRLVQNSPDKSRSDQGGQAYRCVCGESGTSPVRSKCGILMCSKCSETRHAHCRVCTEAEQTPAGIQGEMKKSRLHISLPGHKDGVIKICYRIPDGIQGVSSLHLMISVREPVVLVS